MKRVAISVLFSSLVISGLVLLSCGKKEKEVPVYLLYQDIAGNAEFELDGSYPPPANLDNEFDYLITVTLFFGEDFAGGFSKDQVYGYYLTTDDVDINFIFPFAPAGKYWLSAELVLNDTCYFAKTEIFQHKSDTTYTFQEIRPTLLGDNATQKCFELHVPGLASAEEPVEYVQQGPRCWINKKVYDTYYKESQENQELIKP